jgi:hypothetical protein
VNSPLKDLIHEIAAHCCTGTENRCVAQLLAEFLAHLGSPARLVLNGLVGHLHRGDWAVVWIAWTTLRSGLVWLLLGVSATILVTLFIAMIGALRREVRARSAGQRGVGLWLSLDIVDWENAFLASSKILAKPPVRVHVFIHNDLVSDLEVAVAWLRISV